MVGTGCALFAEVCHRDLEGIVAKHARAPYAEPSTWVKIKNAGYTGARDRHELMGRQPSPLDERTPKLFHSGAN